MKAHRQLCYLLCSILILWATPLFTLGQGGQLDPSFNPMDVGNSYAEGANKDVRSILRQPDGKIIVAGNFTSFNGSSFNRIVRLLPTGLIDPSFQPGSGADSTITSMALQADGKILIGGLFSSVQGVHQNHLSRLNSNGSLDTSFHTGTGTDAVVNVIRVQADQKIFIGGAFQQYNGNETYYLVRINEDGSVDPGFAANGITGALNDMVIDGSGNIYAGFDAAPYLSKMDNTGVADEAFNNSATGANGPVKTLALHLNGNILIGGFFSLYNNLFTNLTRITSTGSIDPSYDNTSGGVPYPVQRILVQPDNRIVVAMGEYRNSYSGGQIENGKLIRLQENGLSDDSFQQEIYTELNENIYALALEPDGKLLVAETYVASWGGSASRYAIHDATLVYKGSRDFKINRYNPNGSRDLQFCLNPTNIGPNREVLTAVTQADGKIILGGFFFSCNGKNAPYCVRLLPNGKTDTNFNAGGSGFNKKVNIVLLQPDGKIIAGGVFTNYNGYPLNGLARLNTDGSLDTSFHYNITPVNNEVNSLALQADGKILVGTLGKAYRLNTDGSTDPGFDGRINAGIGTFFPYIYTIAVQADQKILIGGIFTGTPTGGRINNIARLNTDGTGDAGFSATDLSDGNFPGADNPVYHIALQADGKILVGGVFDQYTANNQTIPCNNIIRLTTEGFVDTAFNPRGNFANDAVKFILPTSDDKMLIGGAFTQYNGYTANRLARLNNDGSFDALFNVNGSGTPTDVQCIASNGSKWLVGGDFNSYNGNGKTKIIRLFSEDVPTVTTNVAVCAAQLPYTWMGNSYSAAGTYQNTIHYPDGSEALAVLTLTTGPGNILGPDRVCGYISEGESPYYEIAAPAGSSITWSVSKRTTMQVLSGQGTRRAAIRFLNGFTSGTIYVKIVNNACGINVTRSFSVTTGNPSTPGAITAFTSVTCPAIGTPNALAYSIRKVNTASGYSWTAPPGATLTHANAPGANDTLVYLTLDTSFATGLITVQSVNDCGVSNTRGLTVERNLPATPGSISGPSNVCSSVIAGGQADVAIFNVPLVNAVTYNWTVPAGAIVNPSFLGPNYIEVYFPENFSDGVVSVTASNGCGTSNARLFNVRAQVAVIPGSITETAIGGDCTAREYTYSMADMPLNADSVIWSVPAGGTIVSGQGSTSITVTYTSAAVSGFVTAYSTNHCSISANRKYTVNIGACSPFSFAATKSATTNNSIVSTELTAVVFPNPSVHQFNVRVNSQHAGTVMARLLDGAGRFLQEASIQPNQIWQLGNALPAGLYVLELTQGDKRKLLRLVKQ